MIALSSNLFACKYKQYKKNNHKGTKRKLSKSEDRKKERPVSGLFDSTGAGVRARTDSSIKGFEDDTRSE